MEAFAARLRERLDLLVARWRRGGEMPHLVAPALVVATALQSLLGLGTDRLGTRAAGLREVAGQLRGMAEVVEDLAAAEAWYAALRATAMPTTDPTLVLELALLVVVGGVGVAQVTQPTGQLRQRERVLAVHAQVAAHER